jgi:hypothetical protein
LTAEIRKKLSPNDLGETGSHMAGILIPKEQQVLDFFPSLDKSVKNPRSELVMHERNAATRWVFNFIYYNNRFFGGTRNEYRLTCMTQYLRASNAKVGDEVLFSLNDDHSYELAIVRAKDLSTIVRDDGVLVLSGGWKIVSSK